MTTYNKTSLKTYFETGDVPSGADYANLIDSQVNIAETSEQQMAGPLNTTELITSRVSAGTINCTGTFSFTGTFSAGAINTDNITASAANFTDVTTTHVSAAGTVYASAQKYAGGIVSALGTTQATAALLTYTINNVGGVADGSTTGVILLSNQQNRVQYVINGPTSANLWPCVGGQINALSSNAAFGMAASTLYTVIHTAASGYAVK